LRQSLETFTGIGSGMIDQIPPGDLKDTAFLDKHPMFSKKLRISVKRGSFQTTGKLRTVSHAKTVRMPASESAQVALRHTET
jgi:hypothetical protein